jgi:signal transduction histidine kinase
VGTPRRPACVFLSIMIAHFPFQHTHTMSIDPQVIWNERFEQIGALIEQHADLLTDRWAERALQEQGHATSAYRKDMRDHLPSLLHAIGRALANPAEAVPAAHTMLALEHGEQRWQMGWNLPEVIRDYQILRLSIIEFLDETLESPLATREAMAVGLALDEAISASVIAYVGFQESQLRDANRRLSDFLPVLGHELRNPIAAIFGAMEIVRLCRVNDQAMSDAHEIIGRQLEQVQRLLDDISDVSRIMRGQLDLQPIPLDVRELIRQSVEAIAPLMTEREQVVALSLPEQELLVNADAPRLRQVFSNLLSNAAKYTPAKGEIHVAAVRQKDRIIITVRDSGIGIPPVALPHVFEMFWQGPDVRHQGLGIGLGLVSAIVGMHGGKVSASSRGAGRGSEFVVDLPMAAAQRPTIDSPAPAVRAGTAELGLRIMVVDDHLDSGQTLATLLERSGHELRVVNDAPAALEHAASFQPDIILIDIGLPGMDGYELAQELRRDGQFRATPLVAVTGYATDEDRRRTEQAGFDHHLSKPVDMQSLQILLTRFGKM